MTRLALVARQTLLVAGVTSSICLAQNAPPGPPPATPPAEPAKTATAQPSASTLPAIKFLPEKVRSAGGALPSQRTGERAEAVSSSVDNKGRNEKHAARLEVKIDDLEGDVTRCKNEWMLKIEYSVEIQSKTEIGNDPLVVLIELLESGHPVVTADGKPVQWLLPLDHPTKSKKNKREFERTMHTSLGETFAGDLEHLELAASVLNEATAVELAHKTEEVDFDDGHRGGIRGIGLSLFGFGGGVSW